MAETILKDIGLYKNRILSTLLQSSDLCETLLNKKDYTEEDVDSLIYKQVFPCLYIDETQTNVLSYVCVEVNTPRIPTRTIKNMELIIWCYCHKDCMKYSKKDYFGTRADIMSDMVERQLRDSDKFGIGKLQLQSVTYLNNTNSRYYGRQLLFTTPDFKIKG